MTSKIMWFCDSTGDHVILDVTGDHVILWHHRRSCDSRCHCTGDHVIVWHHRRSCDLYLLCHEKYLIIFRRCLTDLRLRLQCVCVCVCVREREDRRRNQWRYKLISTRRDRIAAPGRWLCQSAGDFDCMSKAGSYHLHVYLTWERHQVTRGRWKHPSNKDPLPQHF